MTKPALSRATPSDKLKVKPPSGRPPLSTFYSRRPAAMLLQVRWPHSGRVTYSVTSAGGVRGPLAGRFLFRPLPWRGKGSDTRPGRASTFPPAVTSVSTDPTHSRTHGRPSLQLKITCCLLLICAYYTSLFCFSISSSPPSSLRRQIEVVIWADLSCVITGAAASELARATKSL